MSSQGGNTHKPDHPQITLENEKKKKGGQSSGSTHQWKCSSTEGKGKEGEMSSNVQHGKGKELSSTTSGIERPGRNRMLGFGRKLLGGEGSSG